MAPGLPKSSSNLPSKQFAELGGAPILIHTLRRFAECSVIHQMYVALRKAEIDQFLPRLQQEEYAAKVHLVEGGDNRQESVANALAVIDGGKDDVVLVHDAVRPFIDTDLITSVVQAARKHGAAIAGVPAVDTIKQVERTSDGAIITSTIPRERVVMAQTPQGFTYPVIKSAFQAAQKDGYIGTDEASLVERSGHGVAVVMGSARNFKITSPADMELAEMFLAADKSK